MGPHRSRWFAAALALASVALLAACATGGSSEECDGPDDPACFGVTTAELRIPGPYVPDPAALAAGAARVSRDDVPAWDGGAHCTGGLTPGARALSTYLRDTFPGISSIGGYSCRPNSNAPDRMSVHGAGRALDIMIPVEADDADNGVGDPIANWLIANSTLVGIQYLAWDHTQWSGSTGRVSATPGDPHVNHIHAEVTEEAGALMTAFFTEGPPSPRARLDAVFVASDFPGGTTIEVEAGREVRGCLTYTNLGTVEWLPGTTNLGTSEPRDHASPYPGSDWLAPHRLATISAPTAPGASERFCFSLRGADEPGVRDERFSLVHEAFFWAADTGGVSDATNALTVVTVAAPPAPPPEFPEMTPLADAGRRSPDASGPRPDAGGSTAMPVPTRRTLTGTCSAAPGGSRSSAALLALFVTLAVAVTRRRRRPASMLALANIARTRHVPRAHRHLALGCASVSLLLLSGCPEGGARRRADAGLTATDAQATLEDVRWGAPDARPGTPDAAAPVTPDAALARIDAARAPAPAEVGGACVTDADCPPTTYGPFGACDYVDSCDESGMHTRPATSHPCEAGRCGTLRTTDREPCTRVTTGDACGAGTTTVLGPCGGFASSCDEVGTQTVSVTERYCDDGICQTDPAPMTTRACVRETDGESCGRGGCGDSCRAGSCVASCIDGCAC